LKFVSLKAIQDRLLIEDRAIIFRREVRLSILKQLIQPLIRIDVQMSCLLYCLRINKGISFCQVNSKSSLTQGKLSLTSGNQKCIGAIPSLVIKVKVKSSFKILDLCSA